MNDSHPGSVGACACLDDTSVGQLEYAVQPELAVAALMHLMSRFPATRKQAVAGSIVEHLRLVAADARLPEALRQCAEDLTDEWMAYALLGESEAPPPHRTM